MKLPVTLFCLLLAMDVVLAIALTVDEVPGDRCMDHATYPTMSQAPDGLERHGHVLWLGGAFGVLQILVYAGCIAFSVRRATAADPLKWVLLIGALLHVGAFVAMMLTYQRYLHQDHPGMILGFPAPTAWMLFGMWAAPLFFVLVYYLTFDRWVITPSDLARFHELIEAKRKRKQGAA